MKDFEARARAQAEDLVDRSASLDAREAAVATQEQHLAEVESELTARVSRLKSAMA